MSLAIIYQNLSSASSTCQGKYLTCISILLLVITLKLTVKLNESIRLQNSTSIPTAITSKIIRLCFFYSQNLSIIILHMYLSEYLHFLPTRVTTLLSQSILTEILLLSRPTIQSQTLTPCIRSLDKILLQPSIVIKILEMLVALYSLYWRLVKRSLLRQSTSALSIYLINCLTSMKALSRSLLNLVHSLIY